MAQRSEHERPPAATMRSAQCRNDTMRAAIVGERDSSRLHRDRVAIELQLRDSAADTAGIFHDDFVP